MSLALTLDDIEAAALRLPEDRRAELLKRLMMSFQSLLQDDPIAKAWAQEAARRDQKMDETGDDGISAEEVFRQIRQRPQRRPEATQPRSQEVPQRSQKTRRQGGRDTKSP